MATLKVRVFKDGEEKPETTVTIPAGVLKEDGHKTLHTSKWRTVDHYRTVMLVVTANIAEVKTWRQIEIELDRTALPRPPDGILDVQIDLGSIECAATLVDLVLTVGRFERIAQ